MSPTIEEIADFMRAHELMLATAESCTAGLIAATLADIPGAGQLLDCAFVTYSPDSKKRTLQVSGHTMAHNNLTSEPIAREMVLGAMRNSHANVAISNTGIADDTDDSIPPGTQCFAWAFAKADNRTDPYVFSETRQFSGDRNAIREASARYALQRIPHYFDMIS